MKKINGRGKKALKKQKAKGVIQEAKGLASRLEQKAELVKNDLAAKVHIASP